jgi:hypothetical protein
VRDCAGGAEAASGVIGPDGARVGGRLAAGG